MDEVSSHNLGDFLSFVAEGDIDLLLLEEFHVSPGFVGWFSQEVGVSDAIFDGAWHSVTLLGGESDIVLRVRSHGKRIGILIENKIDAPQQPRQGERYHERAQRHRDDGVFDDYVVVMCAPDVYLESLGDSSYQHCVSYESIRDWFGQESPRSAWRSHVMDVAIEKSRRGYVVVEVVEHTHFQEAYWNLLRETRPDLTMNKPTPKGANSNWIMFKGSKHDFPKGVSFYHKLDQSVVELAFSNRSVSELMAALSKRPEGVLLVQKGKSACLSIAVPEVSMALPFAEQVEQISAAFDAACQLLPYATLLVDGGQKPKLSIR